MGIKWKFFLIFNNLIEMWKYTKILWFLIKKKSKQKKKKNIFLNVIYQKVKNTTKICIIQTFKLFKFWRNLSQYSEFLKNKKFKILKIYKFLKLYKISKTLWNIWKFWQFLRTYEICENVVNFNKF